MKGPNKEKDSLPPLLAADEECVQSPAALTMEKTNQSPSPSSGANVKDRTGMPDPAPEIATASPTVAETNSMTSPVLAAATAPPLSLVLAAALLVANINKPPPESVADTARAVDRIDKSTRPVPTEKVNDPGRNPVSADGTAPTVVAIMALAPFADTCNKPTHPQPAGKPAPPVGDIDKISVAATAENNHDSADKLVPAAAAVATVVTGEIYLCCICIDSAVIVYAWMLRLNIEFALLRFILNFA